MNRNKKQENSVSENKVSHVNLNLQYNLPRNKWRQAAEDARLKIKAHQEKIRLLRQAARVFERYGEQGEPWPEKTGIIGQGG
jgi:hypothetical protein